MILPAILMCSLPANTQALDIAKAQEEARSGRACDEVGFRQGRCGPEQAPGAALDASHQVW